VKGEDVDVLPRHKVEFQKGKLAEKSFRDVSSDKQGSTKKWRKIEGGENA